MAFNRWIARSLAANSRQAVRIERLLVTGSGDRGAKLVRFEQLVALLRDTVDPQLEILDIFDADVQPGPIHHFPAKALRSRSYVLTTNFDSLIEHSFHLHVSAGLVPHTRLAVAFLNERTPGLPRCSFQEHASSCQRPVLFKLHGTLSLHADTPTATIAQIVRASVGATLERIGDQRALQLESFKHRLFERSVENRTLVVLGYSGIDDFDVVPSLVSFIRRCKHVVWLAHSEAPLWVERRAGRHLPEALAAAAADCDVPVTVVHGPTDDALTQLFGAVFTKASILPSVAVPPRPVSRERLAFSAGQKTLILGRLWHRGRHYSRAIHYYRQAARHFAANGEWPSADAASRLEATCQFELGNTQRARTLIERLRLVRRGARTRREGAIGMAQSAKLLRRIGKTKSALAVCRIARRRLSSAPDTHYVAAAVLEAELVSSLGRVSQAIALTHEALSRCRAHRYRPGVARCLMELSKLYRRTGHGKRALRCVRDAHVLFELLGESGNLGTAHLTEGNIHLERGDLDEALTSYKRSLTAGARTKREQGVAVATANIAIVLRNRGAWARAMRLFTAALAVTER